MLLLCQAKVLVRFPRSPSGICSKGATLTGGKAASSNPYPDVKSQKAFEKALLEKTAKQTGDILLFDGRM